MTASSRGQILSPVGRWNDALLHRCLAAYDRMERAFDAGCRCAHRTSRPIGQVPQRLQDRSSDRPWRTGHSGRERRRAPSAGLCGGGPAAALVDQWQHRLRMACAGGMDADRPFFHGLTECLPTGASIDIRSSRGGVLSGGFVGGWAHPASSSATSNRSPSVSRQFATASTL